MKNAVDPASLGRSTAVHSAGSSTGESMDNTGAGGGADKFHNSNAEAISRTMTDASMPKEEKERTMSVNADAAVENGLEWRDKVEDRSARQHIARIMCVFRIVCLVFEFPTAFCDFGLCFSIIL